SAEEWHSEERMLDRIAWLVSADGRDALDAAAAQARAATLPTLAGMARDTADVYRDALQRAALVPALRPASADRCLAARGSAPCHPPPPMPRPRPESPSPTPATPLATS